ncbi:DUF1836 domain-containing protein [Planococcus salinus]|uniref:DUF1836 domain-containing protein n=1 Tax=Planococcus salinus TaxID=1848460 RepID=A0A3M8P643_9BACL|nr:DUF1836 domain-containing protein [Planococcus salinus]RNF39149.1 DUF1836 domain-containing protein [Planococcus salinus]
MDKAEKLADSIALHNRIEVEDIPKIDLYSDQVIQLFENSFAVSKRHEDEKILTKTMINNYAKGKLFYPIDSKKYSRNHVMLINMIYQMKSVLSINDVKKTLEGINDKAVQQEGSLESFYRSYLKVQQDNGDVFTAGLSRHMETAANVLPNEENDSELEKVLLIASLAHMSKLYKRAAEKLVDDLRKGEDGSR